MSSCLFVSARLVPQTPVCIWCQCLFVAEDLLQNTLKKKMTVFWLTLCCAVVQNIKMCYPHLIPSFLVSIMTRGLSRKAGLVGRRANFGFNLQCLSQRRLKFKPCCVAMAANATDQTPAVLFYSGIIDIRVQKALQQSVWGGWVGMGWKILPCYEGATQLREDE